MKKLSYVGVAVLPVVLALTVAAAKAKTPSVHLNPGQWRYHARITYLSGPTQGKVVKRSYRMCVKNKNELSRMLAPHTGDHKNTRCETPRLQKTKTGYHVTMTCRTVMERMTSTLRENFYVKPSASGNKLSVNGRVHQTISGAPANIPAIDLKQSMTGKRMGACEGG